MGILITVAVPEVGIINSREKSQSITVVEAVHPDDVTKGEAAKAAVPAPVVATDPDLGDSNRKRGREEVRRDLVLAVQRHEKKEDPSPVRGLLRGDVVVTTTAAAVGWWRIKRKRNTKKHRLIPRDDVIIIRRFSWPRRS